MKIHWRTLVVAEGTAGETLAARLRTDGHHVDTTPSGQDAIDRARDQQYLTYFVNFEVGGMDGIEIMKEIRRVQPEASIILTCRGPGTNEVEFVALARWAVSGQADDPEPMSLADMEKLLITAALRHTGGNIKESATILGIDRSTLYDKIKKYAIPR
jgi:DNA-binding NtrC family response regulator